jgi:hypothetical protein
MKMTGSKNVKTPAEYLASLDEPRKTEIAMIDAFIRKTVPKLDPFICSGMLAYGPFHYTYASGREGDWFRVGVASNKNYISIYACATVDGAYVAEQFKAQLPKASIGKSCIRFKRWSDLDPKVMSKLLKATAKAGFGM